MFFNSLFPEVNKSSAQPLQNISWTQEAHSEAPIHAVEVGLKVLSKQNTRSQLCFTFFKIKVQLT